MVKNKRSSMESTATLTTNSDVEGSVAKRRWKILRRAVVDAAKSNQTEEDDVSVRRFSSFHLFQTRRLSNDDDGPPLEKKRMLNGSDLFEGGSGDHDDREFWLEYRLFNADDLPGIKIRLNSPRVRVRDLANFDDVDNTGNVCVWPAEEVLAFYLSRRPELVRGKVVLELGGGMTCLAGIVAAKWCAAKRVVMTDGNVKAVENVKGVLEANRLCEGPSLDRRKEEFENDASDDAEIPPPHPPAFTARVLRWDAVDGHAADLTRAVDLVIAADCLFFDAFRQSLVDTLDFLLSAGDDASALIFAPRREKTMEDFVLRAEAKGFVVSVEENYDQIVSDKLAEAKKTRDDSFDDDIHYPLLLKLRRRDLAAKLTES